MVIAYPGRLALSAGTSALVWCREGWITAQFGGGTLIIIERPRPRWSYRHPSTAEVIDSAETAAENGISRVSLRQAVSRGEEGHAVSLREDVGFEGRTPKRGRRRLICYRLICNFIDTISFRYNFLYF